MIVFDSTVMLLLLYPSALPPIDPNTEKPLEYAKERIEYLIRTTTKAKSRVIIPTPVLSEILVKTGGATSEYLDEITNNHVFQIGDFDTRAAIEVASISEAQPQTGSKKHDPNATWAKIKYDRQIVAIAKTNGAEKIYSDDGGIYSAAKIVGIEVVRTWELPVAPEDKQGKLQLETTLIESKNDK